MTITEGPAFDSPPLSTLSSSTGRGVISRFCLPGRVHWHMETPLCRVPKLPYPPGSSPRFLGPLRKYLLFKTVTFLRSNPICGWINSRTLRRGSFCSVGSRSFDLTRPSLGPQVRPIHANDSRSYIKYPPPIFQLPPRSFLFLSLEIV